LIVSNEINYHSLPLNARAGELLIGFGVTANYLIAGIRKNTRVVWCDQSEELLITQMSFWRTLWIISPHPEEFLANVAQFPVVPGETIDSIFAKARNRAIPQKEIRDILQKKLARAVTAKHITEFDVEFTLAVLDNQGKSRDEFFRYSEGGHQIAENLEKLLNPGDFPPDHGRMSRRFHF